jgi:hypothetical protein
MPDYRFTDYFEREVLRKRPYLRREWCIAVLEHPVRVERRGTIGTATGPWSQSPEGGIFGW